ncbi:MAG: hypothetical protein C0404_07390 [Verrucomicrobia bacterium]|nr:hypothetical protein [Verrucomicrobiota bacterium]
MRRWLLATGMTLFSGLAISARAGSGAVIFPDDLDQWQAQVVVGRPGNTSFIQGPAKEGGIAGTGHIAIDKAGNIYSACGTFIQVAGKDGTARVLAGSPGIGGCTDGAAEKATFASAIDIAIGPDGALYVVDEVNLALRKVAKQGDAWQVTTVAGVPGQRGHRDGPGNQALFDTPFDSVAVSDEGVVYTLNGNWLRKFEKGIVTTLNAGTGPANGPLAKAQFNRAMAGGAALSFGNEGELYVADRWNQAIRKVDFKKGEVTTVAGAEPGAKWGGPADGPALQARFHGGGGPYQVLYARKNNFLLAKSADEDTLRIIKDGKMMTFGFTGGADSRKAAEGPIRSLIGDYVAPVAEDAEGNIYLGNCHSAGQMIRKVSKTSVPTAGKDQASTVE